MSKFDSKEGHPKWETIDEDKKNYWRAMATFRMQVPNGWLYRVESGANTTICFVPEDFVGEE